MTNQIDHDRCSEMLPAFLDGSLHGTEAAAVESHLASCDGCRAELRGLEALRSTTGDGLTPAERGSLSRAVMAGIADEPASGAVTPLAPRPRAWLGVAGALGAAATVAVIASVAFFGGGGLDETGVLGDSESAEMGEAGGGAGAVADRRAENAGSSDAAAAGTEREAVPATESVTQAPVPTFTVERRSLTAAELQKRGESSLQSVRFAAYYSANDARGSRTLLEQLVEAARAAAGDDVGDQVDQCGTQVLQTSDPIVPSFGSVGALEGRQVLILGFAWTRQRSGPLDRYMVWAWERGSCDVAIDFVEGKIEKAN